MTKFTKIAAIVSTIFATQSQSSVVPAGFESFYEPSSGQIELILNGDSRIVTANYHKGYFQIEPQQGDLARELLNSTFSEENTAMILALLEKGVDISEECQFLDRVCKVGKEDVVLRIDLKSKTADLYIGESFYKNNDDLDKYIHVSTISPSFFSRYNLYYNNENNDHGTNAVYNGDIDSVVSFGDKTLVSNLYLSDSGQEVEDLYLNYDVNQHSVGAGYLTQREIGSSATNFATLSLSSESSYGAYLSKNPKLKKNKSRYDNVDVYSPVNAAQLTITVSDKVVYRQTLDSGTNTISLRNLPVGRYDAIFEVKVGDRVYEKTTKPIVNNPNTRIALGESYYSVFGYRFEKKNEGESDKLVFGTQFTHKPIHDLTNTFSVLTDMSDSILSHHADIYFSENLQGGAEYTFLNNDLAAYSFNYRLFQNLNFQYIDRILAKDYGFVGNTLSQKGHSISASYSKNIKGFSTSTSYNLNDSDDSIKSEHVNINVTKKIWEV